MVALRITGIYSQILFEQKDKSINNVGGLLPTQTAQFLMEER